MFQVTYTRDTKQTKQVGVAVRTSASQHDTMHSRSPQLPINDRQLLIDCVRCTRSYVLVAVFHSESTQQHDKAVTRGVFCVFEHSPKFQGKIRHTKTDQLLVTKFSKVTIALLLGDFQKTFLFNCLDN